MTDEKRHFRPRFTLGVRLTPTGDEARGDGISYKRRIGWEVVRPPPTEH